MMNDTLNKLKFPAIGLIAAGVLNAICGLYFIGSALYQYSAGVLNTRFSTDAEQIGFYVGFWGTAALGVLGFLVAPVIIYGAIQMMRGRSFGLSRTAAILAVIPLTSCCFVIGIPFGIWALVVLSQPDVKALFRGEINQPQFYPPQPPPNW
jgi:hypothetical protein